MTKHIVADGVLGRLARKQWELQRRVLEGSLDPEDVLQKLQGIIEKAPVATFDIEQVNYTVSEKVYCVNTQIRKDFCEYIKEVGCTIFSKTFMQKRYDSQIFGELTTPSDRTIKRKLRLAQITKPCMPSVFKIQARQSGHILADAWDLIAFFQQSPFLEIVHRHVNVHAFGGDLLQMWWTEEGSSTNANVRQPQYLCVCGAEDGWQLETDDIEDDHRNPLNGDFVLLRDK